jgi:hypothetical protein
MEKTIKAQALEFIASNPCKRKEVVKFILDLNGSTTEHTSGYYGTNFMTWDSEGLIRRVNGTYYVTPLGRKYIKDPNVLRKANAKKRAEAKESKLEYYQKTAREFFHIIKTAEQLVEAMGYDFDRMSQSGKRTLLTMERTLKSYQKNY